MMDWEQCNKQRLVKKMHVDRELITSLMKCSEDKSFSASLLELNERTYSSIIVLCYDSLRELLEALSIQNKYKIYNHECYVYFLKEILREEEFSKTYDRIRKIRNSIIYYGQNLSLEETKIIIRDIKLLIERCKKLLKEKFK